MDITQLLTFLGVSVLLVDAQTFEQSPQNLAVLQTTLTKPEFLCKTDQELIYSTWFEHSLASVKEITLTAAGQLLPTAVDAGYELDNLNENFHVKVPVVDMNRAGEFRCSVVQPEDASKFAQLTVLESNPICTTNFTTAAIEGEVVTYSCDVAYRGAIEPQMQWSTNLYSIDDTIDDSVSGNRTKVTITVTAAEANNGWVYKCLTYFVEPNNPDSDYANNAPLYKSDYESLPLVVHWTPRNVAISPDSGPFYPGENLLCTGRSSPAIDYYTWEDVTNATDPQILEEGPDNSELVVREEWIGTDVMTVRCTVRNTMRDGTSTGESSVVFAVLATTTTTTTTTTVPPSTTEPTFPGGGPDPTDNPATDGSNRQQGSPPPLDTGAIVGIVFGCVGVVVIVLLVVYVVCIKGRRDKEEEANNTRPTGPQGGGNPAYSTKPVPHDQVRTMKNDLSTNPTPGPYDLNPPSYDNQYDAEDPYGMQQPYGDGRLDNAEGLVYADLALDDTPRSRKPIQFGTEATENNLYADVRPGGMV